MPALCKLGMDVRSDLRVFREPRRNVCVKSLLGCVLEKSDSVDMAQAVSHNLKGASPGPSRRLAGALSILACVVAVSMGRMVEPREAQADFGVMQSGRLVGSVAGVRERVDMVVTPDVVVYRVVDVRTGVVLAEGLSAQQLAARFPHLNPSGDIAAPVLMLADDDDVPIGW